MKINVAGIAEESFSDGPGIRCVVFAQGCRHRCPGCHNPETHSFSGGQWIHIRDVLRLMEKNPILDGITLSGGDPFEQAEGFGALAELTKRHGYHVMTYTGYLFEFLLEHREEKGWGRLLAWTDVLVDGPFDLGRRFPPSKFRGSSNQRIIDVPRSLASQRAVTQ
ncbi:MAG: anaerobic ribonucleoside-triphosphate reductase activating protein [Synergistaceae bacterium]|jgi:anaerobic ribonucleoside-triphosphate reductase activating protein|nr:anaerobic ribonucleoside-triphosphate reductase activating protein [Synergistaceae bacterium]